MRKFRITIAVKEYQTYEIEAESKEQAIELWEDRVSSDQNVIAYEYEDDGEIVEITDEGEVKEWKSLTSI